MLPECFLGWKPPDRWPINVELVVHLICLQLRCLHGYSYPYHECKQTPKHRKDEELSTQGHRAQCEEKVAVVFFSIEENNFNQERTLKTQFVRAWLGPQTKKSTRKHKGINQAKSGRKKI